ncbi:beta-ketoacyl-ACP synthase III [Thauera linaloolentis]|uniref:Beta-ketoacyl-[acyl-carrier-protein] synthase III n=1 Tax=Thauera linaloolentis (strain DSM 12138 / JCM 21573 / CCUG 41526 / CIP 105981 / IAM 15112 / NBRC 102519 / 47Lol) TaxID=1123367 RepID=N6Z1S1_THAL4|nr:beta-ketoacyl-ACP synthase III [Thauera linaloolentis]ENO88552.1 3-oxoacyl-(acyl carrier protein) synthase III [Thauera linaloolentis 47Lol = DSM 12138]MCM8564870.1 ketoacyl-ACP synthase III [Thauera linaloolentis]
MIYARITGTGSCLPGSPVSNDDLVARGIDTSDEWIVSRSGIRSRHLAAADVGASDLALVAAERAIEAAGCEAGDIDLIIVATSTPDYIFPSTATLVQARLGIRNGGPAFDVQAVCCGFVYALSIAEKFICSGNHKRALVIGAEVFSRILDWSDRATCVLFGDGAGAVVLEASAQPGIRASALHADGSHHPILCVPGGVAAGQVIGDPFLRMDGQAVFKFAVKVLGEVAHEVLDLAGASADSVDWLIPHQANIRIIQATAKRLGLPMDRVITTLDHHGNTSAASIPLALDEAVRSGKLRSGQRIVIEGVGGGFTWGAALIDF